MNRILLTGSTGFLGKNIYSDLCLNNNIFTLSRSNSNYNCDLINHIPNFNENFDIVIHAAGLAHHTPKSDDDINTFFNSNVSITKNLLTGLEKIKINKFVFISSVSVYGLLEGVEINEEQDLNALDPYGRSKVISEDLITKWCELNDVKLTILRLPLIVAKNPPGNLKYMILGVKYGYYFNIAGGLAKKSMVLASDVSKIIINVAEIGGIYNLTDSYHPNFIELSTCISKQLKKKHIFNMSLSFAIIISKIGDILGDWFPLNSVKLKKITSTLTFDDTKAKNAFNWDPEKVLDCFKIN